MRSLIICEGVTDSYVLQSYLEKTENWKFANKDDLPRYYEDLPDSIGENPKFITCKKGDDYVDICAVGSDTRIDEGFDFLYKTNLNNPKFSIKQVFIVIDRDEREIEDRLKKIMSDARRFNIKIDKLQNDKSNEFTLAFGNKERQLNVVPMIIPFDDFGSLETLLLNSIGEKSDENECVVELAENYIDSYTISFPNKKKRKYLLENGLIAKAKLSAAISLTHPDRTEVPFRNLVLSHNWEEYDSIKKHFKMLNELL